MIAFKRSRPIVNTGHLRGVVRFFCGAIAIPAVLAVLWAGLNLIWGDKVEVMTGIIALVLSLLVPFLVAAIFVSVELLLWAADKLEKLANRAFDRVWPE